MDDKQMREAFEAWWDRDGTTLADWDGAWLGWQAAYAAALERAKNIAIACDLGGLSVGDVIDAIRAEIPKGKAC
ncbi:hypothetical protein K7G19_19775 [Cupriavidus sp. DB3]|uniref:hypothetical protein n=1 Tax=Cupriavidus sp. DB3 TaxID=2873259 RepID=UPI001CF3DA6A|nr:hypothetical protein [Cupriavidus sp. DB3]MCA7085832.1 hypothetical protein [Cupriavidus sp. DB3]